MSDKAQAMINQLVTACIEFGRQVEPDWQTRIKTAQRELREYIAELEARAKRAEKIIEKVTQWGLKSFSDIEWYRMLAEWKGNPLPMTWGDIGELYKKETGLSWDSSSGEILREWAKSKPDMFFEDEYGHICEKKKVPKASIAELEAESERFTARWRQERQDDNRKERE